MPLAWEKRESRRTAVKRLRFHWTLLLTNVPLVADGRWSYRHDNGICKLASLIWLFLLNRQVFNLLQDPVSMRYEAPHEFLSFHPHLNVMSNGIQGG